MRKPKPCPDADQHTEALTGYHEWDAWAEEMVKTHRQVRCPGCNRWLIWEPKTDG
jgi:hypothetical protein